MFEHLDTAHTVIAAAQAGGIEGGKLLGSVGSGGIALALTGVMIAGIRTPKNGKIRKKLSSTQATLVGIAAGVFYASAESIWTAAGDASQAVNSALTSGSFGNVGAGGVSLLLAGWMYFREPKPGVAAIAGIITSGVWAQAGGIWGMPEALILSIAGAVGAV